MDVTFLLPAVLFTLLAVIVATILLNNHRSPPAAAQTDKHTGRALHRSTPPLNTTKTPLHGGKGLSSSSPSSSPSPSSSENKEHRSVNAERVPDVGTDVTAEEGAGSDHGGHEEESPPPSSSSSSSSGPTGSAPSEGSAVVEPCRPVAMETTSHPAPWPERGPISTQLPEPQSTSGLEEVDADGPSLKYVPSVLRMSQLERMMTREEREEEQRAQQEQLAAIFQLLKENQETFGEVSEGDVEEQLKLYSI